MFDAISDIFKQALSVFKAWIHDNQGSIGSYVIKVLIAMVAYIIVSDSLTAGVRRIVTGQTYEDVSFRDLKKSEYSLLAFIMLTLFKWLLLMGLLYELIHQLNIVEIDPTVTMTVSCCIVLLLVLQGYLTKKITKLIHLVISLIKGKEVELPNSKEIRIEALSQYSDSGKFLRNLFKFFSKMLGIVVAVIIVFIINQGVAYVIQSKGRDVTTLLRMTEFKIAQNTETTFHEDNSILAELPFTLGENVTVHTNGTLNIIYIDGRKIGVNTSSRKYRFYNMAINQPELEAYHHTSFQSEDSVKIGQNQLDVFSYSYLYYNSVKNDCMLITVNNTSHRIASMTYFSDYRLIAHLLGLE